MPRATPGANYPVARRAPRKTREEVRSAVIERLGSILMESQLPAADLIKSSAAPHKLLARLGGGMRTNTLTPSDETVTRQTHQDQERETVVWYF